MKMSYSTRTVVMLAVVAGVVWASGVSQAALIHYYQGENNANDSVGSLNGTWNGNEAYATGQVGQAFNLDGDKGADTSVGFTGSGIPASGDWTIAFWAKNNADGGTSLAVPVSQGHGNQDGLAFQYGAWGQPFLSVSGFNGAPSAENDVFLYTDLGSADLNWHHVALTSNDATNTQTMYLDGVFATAKRWNNADRGDLVNGAWVADYLNPGELPLRFGDDNLNGNRNWNGLLDEVRIYDNELTPAEVRSLVPEPASLALTILGLVGIAAFGRRRT